MVISGGDGGGRAQRRRRCVPRELGAEIEPEVDGLVVLNEARAKRGIVDGVEKVAVCVSDSGDGDGRGRLSRGRTQVQSGEGAKLLLWTEVDSWQQHGSELILTGYRRANGCVLECFRSWTYLHNETVNIYSHVLGAVFFLYLPYHLFTVEIPPRYAVATTTDVIVCSTYLLGVAVCFILSAMFHTLLAHSAQAYLGIMALDIDGVLLLMWGATVPLIHYSFSPCRPGWHVAYLVFTTALALSCGLATTLPSLRGPHLGHLRALLFGCFGAGSFLVPILHGMLLYGIRAESRRVGGLGWIGATAVLNSLGVGIYSLKFPERWYPRRFDLFGASHQIMHVMVLAAALTYTVAVIRAFDYRHSLDGRQMIC